MSQGRGRPLDKWTVREKFCLMAAVKFFGDNDWIAVSENLQPLLEPNRPLDWFSVSNCLAQYQALLDEHDSMCMKYTNEAAGSSNPNEDILRQLSYEWNLELNQIREGKRADYKKLQEDKALLSSGKVSEEQLEEEEEQKEKEAEARKERVKKRARCKRSWTAKRRRGVPPKRKMPKDFEPAQPTSNKRANSQTNQISLLKPETTVQASPQLANTGRPKDNVEAQNFRKRSSCTERPAKRARYRVDPLPEARKEDVDENANSESVINLEQSKLTVQASPQLESSAGYQNSPEMSSCVTWLGEDLNVEECFTADVGEYTSWVDNTLEKNLKHILREVEKDEAAAVPKPKEVEFQGDLGIAALPKPSMLEQVNFGPSMQPSQKDGVEETPPSVILTNDDDDEFEEELETAESPNTSKDCKEMEEDNVVTLCGNEDTISIDEDELDSELDLTEDVADVILTDEDELDEEIETIEILDSNENSREPEAAPKKAPEKPKEIESVDPFKLPEDPEEITDIPVDEDEFEKESANTDKDCTEIVTLYAHEYTILIEENELDLTEDVADVILTDEEDELDEEIETIEIVDSDEGSREPEAAPMKPPEKSNEVESIDPFEVSEDTELAALPRPSMAAIREHEDMISIDENELDPELVLTVEVILMDEDELNKQLNTVQIVDSNVHGDEFSMNEDEAEATPKKAAAVGAPFLQLESTAVYQNSPEMFSCITWLGEDLNVKENNILEANLEDIFKEMKDEGAGDPKPKDMESVDFEFQGDPRIVALPRPSILKKVNFEPAMQLSQKEETSPSIIVTNDYEDEVIMIPVDEDEFDKGKIVTLCEDEDSISIDEDELDSELDLTEDEDMILTDEEEEEEIETIEIVDSDEGSRESEDAPKKPPEKPNEVESIDPFELPEDPEFVTLPRPSMVGQVNFEPAMQTSEKHGFEEITETLPAIIETIETANSNEDGKEMDESQLATLRGDRDMISIDEDELDSELVLTVEVILMDEEELNERLNAVQIVDSNVHSDEFSMNEDESTVVYENSPETFNCITWLGEDLNVKENFIAGVGEYTSLVDNILEANLEHIFKEMKDEAAGDVKPKDIESVDVEFPEDPKLAALSRPSMIELNAEPAMKPSKKRGFKEEENVTFSNKDELIDGKENLQLASPCENRNVILTDEEELSDGMEDLHLELSPNEEVNEILTDKNELSDGKENLQLASPCENRNVILTDEEELSDGMEDLHLELSPNEEENEILTDEDELSDGKENLQLASPFEKRNMISTDEEELSDGMEDLHLELSPNEEENEILTDKDELSDGKENLQLASPFEKRNMISTDEEELSDGMEDLHLELSPNEEENEILTDKDELSDGKENLQLASPFEKRNMISTDEEELGDGMEDLHLELSPNEEENEILTDKDELSDGKENLQLASPCENRNVISTDEEELSDGMEDLHLELSPNEEVNEILTDENELSDGKENLQLASPCENRNVILIDEEELSDGMEDLHLELSPNEEVNEILTDKNELSDGKENLQLASPCDNRNVILTDEEELSDGMEDLHLELSPNEEVNEILTDKNELSDGKENLQLASPCDNRNVILTDEEELSDGMEDLHLELSPNEEVNEILTDKDELSDGKENLELASPFEKRNMISTDEEELSDGMEDLHLELSPNEEENEILTDEYELSDGKENLQLASPFEKRNMISTDEEELSDGMEDLHLELSPNEEVNEILTDNDELSDGKENLQLASPFEKRNMISTDEEELSDGMEDLHLELSPNEDVNEILTDNDELSDGKENLQLASPFEKRNMISTDEEELSDGMEDLHLELSPNEEVNEILTDKNELSDGKENLQLASPCENRNVILTDEEELSDGMEDLHLELSPNEEVNEILTDKNELSDGKEDLQRHSPHNVIVADDVTIEISFPDTDHFALPVSSVLSDRIDTENEKFRAIIFPRRSKLINRVGAGTIYSKCVRFIRPISQNKGEVPREGEDINASDEDKSSQENQGVTPTDEDEYSHVDHEMAPNDQDQFSHKDEETALTDENGTLSGNESDDKRSKETDDKNEVNTAKAMQVQSQLNIAVAAGDTTESSDSDTDEYDAYWPVMKSCKDRPPTPFPMLEITDSSDDSDVPVSSVPSDIFYDSDTEFVYSPDWTSSKDRSDESDDLDNSSVSSDVLHEECEKWRRAALLALSRLASHESALPFLEPVTEEQAPGYHRFVRYPMDMLTIKTQTESGVIRSTADLQKQLYLMLNNALMYNKTNGTVYNMAMEMMQEARNEMSNLQQMEVEWKLPCEQTRPKTPNEEPVNKKRRAKKQ